MPAILIVDDEPDLLSLLEFRFQQAGYEVVLAASGAEALERLKHRVPDLVLLDLMLPDTTGTEVHNAIKLDPRTSKVPVVMLTARCAEADRLAGFELGVDDYVTKPFSVRELLLRVNAVLRRAGAPGRQPAEVIAPVGPLRVDVPSHRAYVGKDEIVLTVLEFRLLTTFMSRVGKVQSRETLLADVWEVSSAVDTRTVDTHVKRLRDKLGIARDLLETVRGVGYRLVDPGVTGTDSSTP